MLLNNLSRSQSNYEKSRNSDAKYFRDEVVLPITSRKTILMDETKIMKLRSDQIVIDQEIREVQKRIFSRKNAENDKSLFINRKRPSSQLHT